jgi:hypothetical protein
VCEFFVPRLKREREARFHSEMRRLVFEDPDEPVIFAD